MIITVTQMIIHYAQSQMNKSSQVESKQIQQMIASMPLMQLIGVWVL